MSRPAGLPALALAAAVLAGCGFQLRGEASAGLAALSVSASVPSQVAVQIRRQLSGTATRLAASPKDADAHVRILAESTEKLIQSLTGAGRVFDYQLRLKVEFEAAGPAGQVLVRPTAVELQRVVTYSETAPLAKEAEEGLLFDEMRAEAASRILRQVAIARAGAAKP